MQAKERRQCEVVETERQSMVEFIKQAARQKKGTLIQTFDVCSGNTQSERELCHCPGGLRFASSHTCVHNNFMNKMIYPIQ